MLYPPKLKILLAELLFKECLKGLDATGREKKILKGCDACKFRVLFGLLQGFLGFLELNDGSFKLSGVL